MSQVLRRRPEFERIERRLDNRTLKSMKVLSAKSDHTSRAVANAAAGGLWTFCREAEGSASQLLFDCPAFAIQRKEALPGL
eukprot:4955047-Amphidinium_carterae.1